MANKPAQSITKHFASVQDPRSGNAKLHLLSDIIVIAICATICGADTWVEVEVWAKANRQWLRTFLALPNGIPSHDTFRRVFILLDPKQFRRCFLAWVRAVSKLTHGQIVAIDGKKLRRSQDRSCGQKALSLVSAWATANGVVLGQLKVQAKSNEMKVIPELLKLLDLTGCIVTLDALNCQTKIASQIKAQKADYILAVKENQGKLYADLKDLFAGCLAENFFQVPHGYHRTVNKGHGRIEIRECWTLSEPEFLDYVRPRRQWSGLQTVVMVRAERRMNGKRTHSIRYYISSLTNDARRILQGLRQHWGIENNLHWVMDIAFREDESRMRKGHSAENFAMVRHVAHSLLKQEQSEKIGTKAKRFKAACDRNYLIKVLSI
ncbi:MAG: ISAs1 family transposase [Microcoleus sp. T3-bin5]|nr:ISAs1 family transposase [Microcoleus sp. T3-bin5]